jgi:hypothetical protein
MIPGNEEIEELFKILSESHDDVVTRIGNSASYPKEAVWKELHDIERRLSLIKPMP